MTKQEYPLCVYADGDSLSANYRIVFDGAAEADAAAEGLYRIGGKQVWKDAERAEKAVKAEKAKK
jgi:hypothetical protein